MLTAYFAHLVSSDRRFSLNSQTRILQTLVFSWITTCWISSYSHFNVKLWLARSPSFSFSSSCSSPYCTSRNTEPVESSRISGCQHLLLLHQSFQPPNSSPIWQAPKRNSSTDKICCEKYRCSRPRVDVEKKKQWRIFFSVISDFSGFLNLILELASATRQYS